LVGRVLRVDAACAGRKRSYARRPALSRNRQPRAAAAGAMSLRAQVTPLARTEPRYAKRLQPRFTTSLFTFHFSLFTSDV